MGSDRGDASSGHDQGWGSDCMSPPAAPVAQAKVLCSHGCCRLQRLKVDATQSASDA